METFSVSYENSELDSQGSSSDRIMMRLIGSMDYTRTISEVSTYSELSDELASSYDHHTNNANERRVSSKLVGRAAPSLARLLSMRKNVDLKPVSEVEMIKEKFAKLLLGEDMSGGGKGVCSAVAVSNAITNLYATVFSHYYKLEPLSTEKKTMWRREMDCLLCLCEYIVEFFPTTQTMPDGRTLDVMEARPRSDVYINLPALEKLDKMLLEILDSFQKSEFWYEGKKATSPSAMSFRKIVIRSDEKWWLPIPCVPASGLSDEARKDLQHKRDCANQIHKAAMEINNSVLTEMEIPESYLETLPKKGRASLGDSMYHYIFTTEKFSPDHLLDSLNISSEHEALEIADRVEAAMHIWRRKANLNNTRSSWDMVKDLVTDDNKNHTLAARAKNLLLCLKQRYPGLSQTTLDICKIQYNKDVGQGILESYSRVLESLAFNTVAWIDDVLFVDTTVKKKFKFISAEN